jgi:hypothetical protein
VRERTLHDALNDWLAERPLLVGAIFAAAGVGLVLWGEGVQRPYGLIVALIGIAWPAFALKSK